MKASGDETNGIKHIWGIILGTNGPNFHQFQQTPNLWGIKIKFYGHSIF